MGISTYATLTSAIGTWAERTSLSSSLSDDFIGLAEAAFNRKLGANYRRKTTATINTDVNGEGAIPSDCVNILSLTRNVLGSVPMKQVSWNALIERNPYRTADEAEVFAIKGTTFRVAPITDDDFLAVYMAKLTGLEPTSTTNWLLTLAPDAYLAMSLAMLYAYFQDDARAGMFEAKANSILDELLSQANVAEFGNAEMTLGMVTP